MTVIGGANIDIVGTPDSRLLTAESNPGTVTVSSGGVGRNIAENLARLGVATRLVSVVGDDGHGNRILAECRQAGVDVAPCAVVDAPTSCYLAILGADGDLRLGISEMNLLDRLDTELIDRHSRTIEDSRLVLVDANLERATIEHLFDRFPSQSFFVDTVSSTKASRLRDLIGRAHTIKPNRAEAEVLWGETIADRGDLEKALGHFLTLGVEKVFISLGPEGLFFGDAEGSGWSPAPEVEVINATGAGDAAMAALALAEVREMTLVESASFALAASMLTLSHPLTTHPEMSVSAIEHAVRKWGA